MLIFFTVPHSLTAQESEEDLKKLAEKAFEDEEYVQGYKYYSQLVSTYPKDPNYNYRLGVCMLYSESDKKKCFPFLEFANKNIKESEKEARYYLAKAYHMNYKFDEAIKLYNQYKELGSSAMVKKLKVDHEIQCCKNGKRLLGYPIELVVLEKKRLNEADYFRSYRLNDIGGSLLTKPDQFMTSADKRKKNKSIVYLPKGKNLLFYASYGEKDNKDIYIVRKLPNGDWAKPESLGPEINTEYDEDYPFLHPNGKVLYFASKGHNSMGGYDLFKSELDPVTNKWKKPENLDFPINTPSDDILFVTDSLEKTAFFSSARYSPGGKIDVYRVKTQRVPPDFVTIKGTALKKGADQNQKIKIRVKNVETGEDAGTFESNDSGKYAVRIPNGGKFIFTVEKFGFVTQSEGVNLPKVYNMNPLQQVIYHESEKLVIKNLFEIKKDDENAYLSYLDLIEQKSQLDVNVNDFVNASNAASNQVTSNSNSNNGNITPKNETGDNTSKPKNENKNLTNAELEKMAFDEANELKAESEAIKKDANDASTFITNKSIEAESLNQQASSLIEEANKESDPNTRQEKLNQAALLKENALSINEQVAIAKNIASQLESESINKRKEAELSQMYAEQLKEANASKNNKEAIAKLENLQKELEAINSNKPIDSDLSTGLKKEAIKKEEELALVEKQNLDLNKDLEELKTALNDVNNQLSKTKKKDEITTLSAQKEELNIEIANKSEEINQNKTRIASLMKESESLKTKADFAGQMVIALKNDQPIQIIGPSTLNSNENNAITSNNGSNTNNNSSNINNATNENNSGSAINNSNSGNNNNVENNNSNSGNNNNGENNNSNSGNNNSANNNGNANNALVSFDQKIKELDNALIELSKKEENSKRYEEQNQINNEYISTILFELKEKKDQVKNAKSGADKNRLNKDIKNLESLKKDKEEDVKINNSKIAYFKNLENNAVANNNASNTGNNNNSTDNNTNSNSATTNSNGNANSENNTNNNNTNTSESNRFNSNKDELSKDLNELKKLETEEKDLFNKVNYTDANALASKQEAEKDYKGAINGINKVTVEINNSFSNSSTGASSDSNKEKINQLMQEADQLALEATELRKKANTQTGAAKQKSLSDASAKDKSSLEKRLEAENLKSSDMDVAYSKNESNIKNLQQLSSGKNSAETTKAEGLIKDAAKYYAQAEKLKEEANAQTAIEAKLGSMTNVEEKELIAIQKQEEALAIYMKLNPGYQIVNSNPELNSNSTAALNEQLDNALMLKQKSFLELAEANKAEINALKKRLNELASIKGTNTLSESDLSNAEQKINTAEMLLNAGNQSTNRIERTRLLLDANKNFEDAIGNLTSALNKYDSTSSGNITSTSGNNANTESNGNNSNNGNNGNTNNNGNNGNNGNSNQANSNTNSGDQNTNNNGNNVNSTSNNSTAVNNGISNTEAEKIKSSTEYKTVTNLNNEIVKLEKSVNDEKVKAQNLYEKAGQSLKESTDLRMEAQNTSDETERNAKNEKATVLDQQANIFKYQGDSVMEIVNNTQSLLDSKKKEKDTYAQSLDKKTYDNILTVSNPNFNATNSNSSTTTNNNNKFNFSNSFIENKNKYEGQLTQLNNSPSDPPNLQSKSSLLSNYIKAIDAEIASIKKKANALTNNTDKTQYNQLVQELQTLKTEKQNERNATNQSLQALTTQNNATNNNVTNNNGNATSNNSSNNNVNSNTNNSSNANNTNNTNVSITNSNSSNTTNKSDSEYLSGKGYEVQNRNAYTNSNPIPIDAKLPEGLVFRVQMGAFKNKIPQDNFKGLKPVSGETTAQGYIRYMAGMFKDVNSANSLKNDVKGLGYNDAFVVAYFNGKKINMSEALAMLNQQGVPTSNAFTDNGSVNENNTVPAVNAIDLKQINGMLFTVQIGVYSNKVSSAQLYNLQPVYREQINGGLYRYTAGIYNSIEKVKTDRLKVNELGIKDAFVSAYFNGERLKIADALTKISNGQNIVFPPENPIRFNASILNDSGNNATLPSNPNNTITSNNIQPFSNGVSSGPAPTAENGVKLGDEGITFKIQIGAYKNQVPQATAANFLKIKTWPIKADLINGLYLYTIGSFVDVKSAKPLLQEAKADGITDAFITVYKDGKKLYGNEASQYLNR